jgi:hypothetical protein
MSDQPGTESRTGRPSSYEPRYAVIAEAMCKLGATQREVAEALEVSERTVERWKAKYEDFCRSLKIGAEPADDRVEQSLYRRATGYTFDACKVMTVGGEPASVPYVEHVPPDVTACIFWLKNRRKEKWRDKTEVDHGALPSLSDALKAARERSKRGA